MSGTRSATVNFVLCRNKSFAWGVPVDFFSRPRVLYNFPVGLSLDTLRFPRSKNLVKILRDSRRIWGSGPRKIPVGFDPPRRIDFGRMGPPLFFWENFCFLASSPAMMLPRRVIVNKWGVLRAAVTDLT